MIIAIDNSYGYHSVGYLDISVTDSEWNFGNRIFLPPNKSSKIVAIENVFLFSIGGVTRNNVAINNVFSLDLSNICHNWVEKTPMLSPRKNFAVCTHEKRVYAVSKVFLNSLQRSIISYKANKTPLLGYILVKFLELMSSVVVLKGSSGV